MTNKFTKQNVQEILINNGINDDYFEMYEGLDNKVIELGCEAWCDVVSEITGKDVYEEELNDKEIELVDDFMKIVESLDIEFI